jgi:hypothetical protein
VRVRESESEIKSERVRERVRVKVTLRVRVTEWMKESKSERVRVREWVWNRRKRNYATRQALLTSESAPINNHAQAQNIPGSAALTGEDQALLVRRDALLVLDLGLHEVDRVRRVDLQSDGLPGERLDEDLHAATQAEHQVKRGLLLDVVVWESAAVLELLAWELKEEEDRGEE